MKIFTQIRHASYENRNLLKLKERGLISTLFPNKPDDFEKLIISPKSIGVYCGFDPTASSLHIGNLLALKTLIHAQRSGHRPVVVIGSATALIGDPSGKSTDRIGMRNEEIIENSQKIEACIRKIFANHEKYFWNVKKDENKHKLPSIQILNNLEWYQSMNVLSFYSNFARVLRMGPLLSRKQIETRLQSPAGINYTEFSYQVFQAYDWYNLLKKENCRIQIGGNDQTGNITTGFEFIQALKKNETIFGLTLPLLTKDGEKLGKSAGNAVWIDREKLPTFQFYQYFLNTSDQMIESYLKLFTFLSLNEIDDLMMKHRNSPHEYLAQRTLAEQLTVLVAGSEGLESAVRCTKVLFGSDMESLVQMNDNEIDTTFTASKVHKLVHDQGMNVLDVLLKIRAFANVDETLQIIKQNGVSFNNRRIENPHERIKDAGYILANNLTLIKVGKKTFHIIKWFKEL